MVGRRHDTPDGAIYRFNIRVTIGPTDRPLMDVMRWVVGLLLDAYARARFPVSVAVEPVRDE